MKNSNLSSSRKMRVHLPSWYIFWFVALERVYVEDCSKTATVWPGSAFDTDVEFSAVCGVSMSAVKTRLIDIGWVRAHETFSNF